MSTYASLFLKQFNPCADRVESIEKSIREELDQHTSNELADHIEKCKRCRRYHGFMESVEKGFREHEVASSEIGPIGLSKLPSKLQDEMSEAMKRNLSKWMFELGRGIMYRQGMITPLFLDLSEQQSLMSSFRLTSQILNSLQNMNALSPDDRIQLSRSTCLLNFIRVYKYKINYNSMCDIFDISIHFDRYNLPIYYYFSDLISLENNFDKSITISEGALNLNVSPFRRSSFLNDIGRFYYKKNHITDAINYYIEALTQFDLPFYHLNIGLAYLNMGNPNNAFNNFNNSLISIDNITDIKLRSGFMRHFSLFLMNNYDEYNKLIESNNNLKNLFKHNGSRL